jgi:hypothetical protein
MDQVRLQNGFNDPSFRTPYSADQGIVQQPIQHVTTPAVNLPSGDDAQTNADDTNTNKAPWYLDFIEGGDLAKNIVRDAYHACTWKRIWRMTMDRLPFLEWMQKYTLVKFFKDTQAGFVVATLVIPQVRM